MTRVAFVGKAQVTKLETSYLEALGEALALADTELVTTPAGGAALALARGWSAATSRQPELSPKPITQDGLDAVLFYDDNKLYRALLDKDPTPIDGRWIVIASIKRLETFAEIAMQLVAEDKDPWTTTG